MILLPNDSWEIKKIKNKGKGVFTKKRVLKGSLIGDYLGKILRPQEALIDESNFYLMYYHDGAVISPDLKKEGIHLLNNSCQPNCFLYIYKGHSLVFALRNILKGEELTIRYLLPPIDRFCDPCPHVCKCGSALCVGNMHMPQVQFNLWRNLTERQAKETKREKVFIGKDLKPLSNYPKKIPSDYINEINKLSLLQ